MGMNMKGEYIVSKTVERGAGVVHVMVEAEGGVVSSTRFTKTYKNSLKHEGVGGFKRS